MSFLINKWSLTVTLYNPNHYICSELTKKSLKFVVAKGLKFKKNESLIGLKKILNENKNL